MAGLFSKVTNFARSPQGKKLIAQAQAAAKDPKNRAKVEQALRGKKPADGSKPADQTKPVSGEVIDPPKNRN